MGKAPSPHLDTKQKYRSLHGISQVVNIQKEEMEAYRLMMEWSRQRKHFLLEKSAGKLPFLPFEY
jgi:hypothetical protein